jgi:hypothetical protein
VIRRLLLAACLLAPALAAAQDAPILRVDLEAETAIPGQPIVLRVTALAPTWFPKPPVFPDFEVPNLLVRLPERASAPVSERIEGATWSGVSRAYRLYPMVAGRFRIPPREVIVTYADPETRAPVEARLATGAIVFAGVIPEAATGLDPFIAARRLSLTQEIEGEPAALQPGGAVTRRVTARIEGAAPMTLPSLIPPVEGDGLAAYPESPVVTETEARGVLSGERREAVTWIAETGGRSAAPDIRLDWFNLETGAVETATLDGFAIVATGPPATPRVAWRMLGLGGLAALALIAVAVWLIIRFVAAWRSQRRARIAASEANAYAKARAAIARKDVPAALAAVVFWDTRLPPAPGPTARRLQDALAALAASQYGRTPVPLGRDIVTAALEALSTDRTQRLEGAWRRPDEGLPPMNPVGAQLEMGTRRLSHAINPAEGRT